MKISDLKARREVAQQEKLAFQPMLDDAYQFAIPYRKPANGSSGAVPGENRANLIFDQTAPVAVFRGAGRLQQDLCPVGEQWGGLELGPIGKRLPDADKLAATLDDISETVDAGFHTGEWDTAFHEMATDLQVSTGAMLILEGDDDQWMRFLAVPTDEVLFEPGRFGDIGGIFWRREWTYAAIEAMWPDAVFSDEFKDRLKTKPQEKTAVCQDTVYDAKQKRWCLYVWLEKDEKSGRGGFIHKAKTYTCPWLTPRYFKVPGETMGRGQVLLAMPAIKTLNKAVELTLKAAAITLLGIYTYTPHSGFNPDVAMIQPGAFWPVASNGGVLGDGIKKLEPPRLDLSQIVFNELRTGVQATLGDQALPPDAAAVRSATEIVERVKRLASDHNGASGRLVKEIVIPAWRRAIEIAYNKQLIPHRIRIDQLLIALRIKSPLQQAQRIARVERVVQFLAMATQVAPQETMIIMDREELLVDLAVAFGVERKFIRTTDNRAKIKQQVADLIAQAVAASQLAEQKKAKEPPAPAAPATA